LKWTRYANIDQDLTTPNMSDRYEFPHVVLLTNFANLGILAELYMTCTEEFLPRPSKIMSLGAYEQLFSVN
jgi:hypothetical protein